MASKSRAKPHPTGDIGPGKWLVKEGDQYERWTVLSQDLERRALKKQRYWFCRCACGVVKSIAQGSLRAKTRGGRGTNGCGASGCRPRTHGQSKTDIYKIWGGMKARCENPNDKFYSYYGGRGIIVCSRWQDFTNFIEDMSERPGIEYSVDRIDTNGNYVPGNCRWATRKEQQGNMRSNVFLEHEGKRMHLSDWARDRGLTVKCVQNRHRRGYCVEDILHPGRLPKKMGRGHGNYAEAERSKVGSE